MLLNLLKKDRFLNLSTHKKSKTPLNLENNRNDIIKQYKQDLGPIMVKWVSWVLPQTFEVSK